MAVWFFEELVNRQTVAFGGGDHIGRQGSVAGVRLGTIAKERAESHVAVGEHGLRGFADRLGDGGADVLFSGNLHAHLLAALKH